MSRAEFAGAVQSEGAAFDLFTVVAIALLAYALVNLLHEGIGHGGACMMLGASPVAMSSVHFDCSVSPDAPWKKRGVAAAGTFVNFVAGAIALQLLRSSRARVHPHRYYFLWLFATLNLLMGAGYFLFSGAGNIGDWAVVADGVLPPVIWRPAMAILGALLYFILARQMAGKLRPLVGDDQASIGRGRWLTWPAYLAGGAMYCLAGLLNPVDPVLIVISGAAASFGGASGLIWLPELLRYFDQAGTRLPLARRLSWIVASVMTVFVFVVVLGRGIDF